MTLMLAQEQGARRGLQEEVWALEGELGEKNKRMEQLIQNLSNRDSSITEQE